MKATKLPSGSWRVLVYLGTDQDGKKIQRSVTAPTKKEALMKASHIMPREGAELTVQEVVERYIELKKPVLSPSTVRSYVTAWKTHIKGTQLGAKKCSIVSSVDAQSLVSRLSVDLSPKTVRNVYSLFSAAMTMYNPDFSANVKMPQRWKQPTYAPQDRDIAKILKAAKDTPLEAAVLLAAFCGLRRGEICALDCDDVDRLRQRIYVNKATVKSVGKGYELKPPKTEESNRIVPVPDFVLAALPLDGPLVDLTPGALTTAFGRLVQKAGLPHFRFHDLRHYYATRLSYAGVPNRINRAINGWRTDRVFKAHYEDLVQDELEKGKTIAMDEMKKIHDRMV